MICAVDNMEECLKDCEGRTQDSLLITGNALVKLVLVYEDMPYVLV